MLSKISLFSNSYIYILGRVEDRKWRNNWRNKRCHCFLSSNSKSPQVFLGATKRENVHVSHAGRIRANAQRLPIRSCGVRRCKLKLKKFCVLAKLQNRKSFKKWKFLLKRMRNLSRLRTKTIRKNLSNIILNTNS